MKVVWVALIIVLDLLLGLVGLSLLFSDLGPGETLLERIVATVFFYFVCAVFIGFVDPQRWLLGLFVAWGGILLGLIGLIGGSNRLEAVGLLLTTIVPVILGGLLGAWVRRRGFFSKLLARVRGR